MDAKLIASLLKNPDQLSTLPHSTLYQMRMQATPDQQAVIAPYEHQAFAREFAQESPLKAALSLPIAIPAYSAAKALGLMNTRSPASWSELSQGYKGLAQGLFGL